MNIEAIAEVAYSAFLVKVKNFLPASLIIVWGDLPPALREAWMAAAQAARDASGPWLRK